MLCTSLILSVTTKHFQWVVQESTQNTFPNIVSNMILLCSLWWFMVLVPAGHSDSKSLRFPNSFVSLNPHIYLIDARVLWTRSSNVLASLHSSPDLLPLAGFMTSSSLTWATAAGSWLASLSLTIHHPAINNYHFKSKPQYSTLPSKLRGLAYRHLPNLVPNNLFGVISYTSPEPLGATVNFFFCSLNECFVASAAWIFSSTFSIGKLLLIL